MSDNTSRRTFLKSAGVAIGASLATALPTASPAKEPAKSLQVWSCGGLAEAMMPANTKFTEKNGNHIAYTGAFAGALGKSLLGGGAQTEVFAPRVLELAQKLKAQGKMLHYTPLCYTSYVLITPKGNPAGIETIADLKRNDVKTVLIPDASPPGGNASMIILKKAGVLEAALKNAVVKGDCVQTSVPDIVSGKGDVAVVEYRLTQLPQFKGKVEAIDISEIYYPPVPIPFTIGLMKWAKDKEFAEEYIRFILSDEGQAFFTAAGFIAARSELGERLTFKYGVNDA
jgi:molybdate transport system substrate-binding protein